MTLRILIVSTICSILMLGACSKPDRDENVFLEQTKTMDKARAVEGTLMDAQKKRHDEEAAQSGQ